MTKEDKDQMLGMTSLWVLMWFEGLIFTILAGRVINIGEQFGWFNYVCFMTFAVTGGTGLFAIAYAFIYDESFLGFKLRFPVYLGIVHGLFVPFFLYRFGHDYLFIAGNEVWMDILHPIMSPILRWGLPVLEGLRDYFRVLLAVLVLGYFRKQIFRALMRLVCLLQMRWAKRVN